MTRKAFQFKVGYNPVSMMLDFRFKKGDINTTIYFQNCFNPKCWSVLQMFVTVGARPVCWEHILLFSIPTPNKHRILKKFNVGPPNRTLTQH